MGLYAGEYLGDGEQADDGDEKVDPVHQVQVAEGEARQARRVVDSDHADADARRDGRLDLIVRGHAALRAEGEQVESEVLRRAEREGDVRHCVGEPS